MEIYISHTTTIRRETRRDEAICKGREAGWCHKDIRVGTGMLQLGTGWGGRHWDTEDSADCQHCAGSILITLRGTDKTTLQVIRLDRSQSGQLVRGGTTG